MKQRDVFLLVALLMIVTLGILIVGTAPSQIGGPDPSVPAVVETSREIIKQFRNGTSHPTSAAIPNPIVQRAGTPHYSEVIQPTNRPPTRGWDWYDTNIVHTNRQTNTYKLGTREITLITKYGVNTNTVFNYLGEMCEQDAYVEVRLAELAALAKNLKTGMEPSEVFSVIGEEPVKLATNHLGLWAMYSPHPLQKLPDLGNSFTVFKLRYNTRGGLEKWWFDSRQ